MKKAHHETFHGLLPGNQSQNMALSVLYMPHSLHAGKNPNKPRQVGALMAALDARSVLALHPTHYTLHPTPYTLHTTH